MDGYERVEWAGLHLGDVVRVGDYDAEVVRFYFGRPKVRRADGATTTLDDGGRGEGQFAWRKLADDESDRDHDSTGAGATTDRTCAGSVGPDRDDSARGGER